MKASRYITFLALAGSFFLTSCAKEDITFVGGPDIVSAQAHFDRTKGAPLEEVPDVFTLYAAAYTGSVPGATNYIYGETMTKTSDKWVSVNSYGSIPSDRSVFYWAVGGSAGTTLPTASATGWPKISYESPATAAAQEDIIVASSIQTGSKNSLTLPFGHILCAVEAKVSATGAFDGTITSIKLKNVFGQGDYTLGSGWSNVTAKMDLTSSLSLALTEADGGKAILSGASTLMLIPQTLPDDAAIEVTVTVGGQSSNVSAALTGVSIAAGRKAVLNLDLSNFEKKILTVESVALVDWVKEDKTAVMTKTFPLLKGVFSVGSGKRVKFTSGNLYWDGKEFSVEVHQYDYQTSWSSSHVDHFYWSKDVGVARAKNYNESSKSKTDTFFAAEGGVMEGFTVLSKDEWQYLFDHALVKDSSGQNLTVINGKNCLVFKPDEFEGTVSDSYTAQQWEEFEEQYGLAALPYTGFHEEGIFNFSGGSGNYWCSNPDGENSSQSYYADFNTEITPVKSGGRASARCVRLVRVH